VAAIERGVNRTVYKLLQGYLRRSVWLYAVVGLLQFSLTGLYWLRGWGRAPIAAMELGLWGAAAALNANSLVWRSLPIAAKDASVLRWWAMVGAPGIYLTLLTGVTWASHRSSGFPIPALEVIWEGIFANLAVLGMAAVLLRSPRFYVVRAPAAKATATVTVAIILQCYGLPVGSAARPYSIVFTAVGMVFLIVSAVQAFRGKHWRWPDIATASFARANRSSALSEHRYGMWTVLLPLLRRTAITAAIATALLVVLHFIFPDAGAALFWVYFIGLSSAGFLLTFQFRSALQPLRCLPLSTKQLAGLLLVFGALPGVVTLGLAFLINVALLKVDLDFRAVAIFALIIIASQALPLPQPQQARAQGRYLGRWFPMLQRILLAAYIGVMAGTYNRAFVALWWFRWGLVVAGLALCVSGYFILVYQLRAGIRPSSNDRVFSAG
jgi:hypothetical protein